MNGIVIVLLVAGVALLDLFRLRAKNTTLSRTGFLVAALPRALMPLAAAAGLGAWMLTRVYEGIAERGSAGLVAVAGGTAQSLQTLLAGVVGFLLTLVIALVIAASRREDVLEPDGSRRRGAAAVGILIIALAIGAGWMAMDWTDRIAVGMLKPMTRDASLPEVPATYRSYGYQSGQEAVRQSEWVVTGQRVGGVLCGVAVVLCFLTSFLFSRVWFSRTAWQLARAGVFALVAGAALYSAHLWSGADWLRRLMRG